MSGTLNINNNKNITAIDIPQKRWSPESPPATCQMPGGAPCPHTATRQALHYLVFLVCRSAVGGYQGERERENETAICLWDALSGRSNAHILEAIGRGGVPATSPAPFTRAVSAAADFPGIVLDAHGPRVNGYLFLSDRLAAHQRMLTTLRKGTIGCRWRLTDDGYRSAPDCISFGPGVTLSCAARHGTAAQRDRESGVVSANAGGYLPDVSQFQTRR